jgi:preprotein translocase subunit SecA
VRAKGIEDKAPPLTYVGPSEDGSAEVQRRDNGDGAAAVGGTTRRERREAARRAAKSRKG